MMKKKWASIFLTGLVFCAFTWGGGAKEVPKSGSPTGDDIPAMTIKLGTFAKPNDFVGPAIIKFMDIVKEKTGGKVQFDFLHSNSLGPEQGAFEMLQANTIQMFVFGFVSNKKILGLYAPFLVKSFEHADRIFSSDVGTQWRSEVLGESGVYMIGPLPRPARQLTTTDFPVKSIADVKGKKIRVPGIPILFETWKAFGADPVAMDFMQVYTSMQQGVIVGQDNPLDVTIAYSLFEVQKYQMVWDYIYFPVFLNANNKWWTGLSPKLKEIILSAYGETKKKLVEDEKIFEKDYVNQIKGKGLTVIYLEPSAVEEFRRVAQNFNKDYLGKLWGPGVMEKIVELGKDLK